MDYSKVGETLRYHQSRPDVSLHAYVRTRQIALGLELQSRIPVYLDTRYWLLLRNAILGRSPDSNALRLTNLLKRLVRDGKIFCPISESTFTEILKQTDKSTLSASAQLIDDLSLGVSLISFDTRSEQELAHYLHEQLSLGDLYDLDALVWTKISYVLGRIHPTETAFDPADELAIQKAFFDHLWDCSAHEMMMMMLWGHEHPEPDAFEKLALRLNTEKEPHAASLKSFKQSYEAEIGGAVDVLCDRAAEMMLRIVHRIKHPSIDAPYSGIIPLQAFKSLMKLLIFESLRKIQAKHTLRSAHISACLHANIRWDKGRKFRENDFIDFGHAAAAIAYCDYFLTEGPLRHLVTTKNTALDKVYNCRVVSKISDAIEILQSV